MKAKILDGRAAQHRLLGRLRVRVHRFRRPIQIASVLVGSRPDSTMYVRLKRQAATKIGIRTRSVVLSTTVSQRKLLRVIQRLNHDRSVHGILLQLPLPGHLNTNAIITHIRPDKDVDGFHPQQSAVNSPTALAVLYLLKLGKPKLNSRVVILGRPSALAIELERIFQRRGWPVTRLFRNWTSSTRQADVIVTMLGRGPRLLGSQVKTGAIVIDVGIRIINRTTVGDVAPSVWNAAKAVSPVPGGVGPLTVYYVLQNTYTLATHP